MGKKGGGPWTVFSTGGVEIGGGGGGGWVSGSVSSREADGGASGVVLRVLSCPARKRTP